MTLAAHRADVLSPELSDEQAPLALRRLSVELLQPAPEQVARTLLGKYLVCETGAARRVGRIVETEAYSGPEDLASHARAGRTRRAVRMFGPPGLAYVYLIYGMYHCLNVVCAADGQAAAVLVRAVEPVTGVALMRERRGHTAGPEYRLAAGPARTCQAFDVDRSHDGIDLIGDAGLWLAGGVRDDIAPERIVAGPRVGVAYAGPDWGSRPWRFGVRDSPALSRPFPASD